MQERHSEEYMGQGVHLQEIAALALPPPGVESVYSVGKQVP